MHAVANRPLRALATGVAAAALLLLAGTGSASAALVAAYGFEEASGTAVQDVSTSANNGTLTGATRTASGRHGAALSFDGVNDWVTVADANSLDLTGAMTVEAWVNPVAMASGSWATILLKERSGDLSYGLYANTDTNRPSGHAFIGGVDRVVRGTAQVALGTWTHLATTYDGANLRLYVNGTLVTTQARTGAITTSTGVLRIGGNASWGEYFNGRVDEVRVYNNALTAAQIATDMTTPIGPAAPPTPDTTPPTVAVTAPTAGATVSGAVPVSATASDGVGVVGVQFRLDGQPLGTEDTTAPYSISWPTTATTNGSHTLTAVARDAAGNLGTSANLTVTVDNGVPDTTAPTVAITAPVDASTVSGAVQVAADAADAVGVAGVQFRLDGQPLGAEDTTAPYAVQWATSGVANGAHTLTAVARDAAGNTTTSSAVGVTVSNTAPPPATGLVAAYSFDNGAGTATPDLSGTGNNGTISGATWNASGRHGGALSFDGVNDWVTVPDANSLDLTTGMTLEAWVNPVSVPVTSWPTVLLKERPGNLSYSLYANADANRPEGHVFIAGADRGITGTSPVPAATWTHLALTYDNAELRLYVNGGLVATQARTGDMLVGTGVLRIGGNGVWASEFFNGRIDEVRVYNRALSAAEITTDMATPLGGDGTPPGDVTPPTVSLTAPANGASVTGTVALAASAADAGGVAGVQFRVDGNAIGGEDTTAPYGVNWNSGGVSPGTHALTAVARDTAGNITTSAAVTVTVTSPGSDPAVVGQWGAPLEWPLVPVHMMLMRNGRVMMFDGFADSPNSNREWDPATNTFISVPYARNLFCSLHVALADGRLAIFGGHINAYQGLRDLSIYDPGTRAWRRGPDMARGRWYPTATMLADGRVLVVSGDNIVLNRPGLPVPLTNGSDTLPEIYDPASDSWSTIPSAARLMPLYPFMFLLPNGRVFDAGPDLTTRTLDVATGTWSAGITAPIDGHSAVMYRPGLILKSGTWGDTDFPNRVVDGRAAVVNMNAPNPAWREVAPMAFARSYHTLTVLPDGTVFGSGGGRTSDGVNIANSVFQTELWNPATETWTTMSSLQRGRLYHSSALLLPDGRVLVAGGGQLPGQALVNQRSGEIFSPPYLFKGPRPTIASAPGTATYGSSFDITTPDAARIASVSLIRLGSVTHNVDADQRYVPVNFTRDGTTLTLEAPASPNVAPPGYYMLFIVDTNGVPSVSTMVQLPLGATPPPPDTTPPAVAISAPAAAATVDGTVQVTANATDAVGVAGVQFRVDGQPVGLEDTSAPFGVDWNTTTVADGSHTLTAVARDAAGNTATSASVTVTVSNVVADTTPPTVSITAPAAAATVSGAVQLAANAADAGGVAGVQFRLDGQPLGAEDTAAPYAVEWPTTAGSNGSHTLTAVARDAAGNTATSAEVVVTVDNATPDTTPPAVALSAPADGATVSGSVPVTATASDAGGVVGLQFRLDGQPLGAEDTSAPYAATWVTAFPDNGPHTLTAVARDAAGNTATSAAVAVTVANAAPDTVPPTVAVTAPAGGATVSGSVQVTGGATDSGGVVGVQFRLDGQPLGAEDTTAPYAVTWATTTASNGPHSLTAVARDTAGNSATSAAVAVTVSNTTPPATGVVAAYGFNEGSGTTTTDASGRGNAGAISGATWSASGRIGGALAFDGVNDWVTIADANSLDLTGAMTLEAWVFPTSMPNNSWPTVLLKERAGDLSYGLYANTDTNRPSGHAFIGADRVLRGTARLATGAWSHLALTYNGTILRFYVNGTQVATQNRTGNISTGTGPLRIGGNASWTNEFLTGRIDEVRVYNRALSAAEIAADMTAPITP